MVSTEPINYNRLNIENYLVNLMNLHHRSAATITDLVNTVCVKELIDKSEENNQRVCDRLNNYISNPDDENIHNIRTAIRRLEASYICLPKNIRKRKVIKNYATFGKELFRINSEVRDCDVILERLSEEL
jgi:CHAD domain-containing protein